MDNDTMRAELIRTLGADSTLTFSAVAYNVIFDNEYVLVDEVEERAPVAQMLTSEVTSSAMAKGGSVSVYNSLDGSTKAYVVRRLEHDGTGMTKVILGKA